MYKEKEFPSCSLDEKQVIIADRVLFCQVFFCEDLCVLRGLHCFFMKKTPGSPLSPLLFLRDPVSEVSCLQKKALFSPSDYIIVLLYFIVCLFFSSSLPEVSGGAVLVLPLLFLIPLLSVLLFYLHAERRCRSLLLCAAAVLLVLRLAFFARETSDFTDFLKPWTEWLRVNGGFRGLRAEIGNYNVPYMVMLALFSRFDFPELYLIKYASTLFDLLQAFCLYGIVFAVSGSRTRAAAAFVFSLLLPTVLINSAVWGQCDSMYVSLALLAFCLALNGKTDASMIALGFSFSLKLQAVFIMPVFFPLLLSGRLKWRSLPLFPASYLLAVSPALLAGRRFRDVMLFYVSTASTAGSSLNYNSPSVFSLPAFYGVSSSDSAFLSLFGIAAAAAVCLIVCLVFLFRRKHISEKSLLFAALLLVCGIPLFLPHMHDRYFYLCDLLTLAAACVLPCSAFMVPFSQFASLLGYYAYFRHRYLYPMRFGFYAMAVIFLLALILMLLSLFRSKGQTGTEKYRSTGS